MLSNKINHKSNSLKHTEHKEHSNCRLMRVPTQLVAVGEKDSSAVENMRQSSLDQLPARDALDGFGEGWREPVEFVLHQHPLK